MNNKGLDLAKEIASQSPLDWKFGALSQECIAVIPAMAREMYLPKGETQFGKEDFQDCVTRAFNNILETKLNWLLQNKKLPDEAWFRSAGYITENGFELSDRFIAIGSGTSRYGNSLKAPLDFLRKNGAIPKKMLPKESWMTFDDYMNPHAIMSSMFKMGDEFLKRITINYEQVPQSQFPTFDEMLAVVGHGWPIPINGEYPRNDLDFNHAFMDIRQQYYIFDNYEEGTGDFIKKLAPDYKFFDYGYRLILSLTPSKKDWWTALKEFLRAFLPQQAEETIHTIETAPNIKLPVESQSEATPIPVTPKYLWDTPEQARHSFRVICDESGLSVDDKNLLSQVLNCESGFKAKTVHPNSDKRKTVDNGIAQFNDFWYNSVISPEDALNNPEKACRVFISEFKQGNLKNWVCYSSKLYLNYKP